MSTAFFPKITMGCAKKKKKKFWLHFVKSLVHPKMKIMSLMTHPHVVPSP